MNFSEKLQKIRKENNITQEQLADKLNVSRQAVSKWESGTAYPDTEKLIQISKIFNISLDELINNRETEKIKVDKKINLMDAFDKGFNFTSKLVSMFWSMRFKEKIKFLFEIGILILIIWVASLISTDVIVELVRRIFVFLPDSFVRTITYLVDTFLYLTWIILGCVIVYRVLKTRYLDYYVIITDKNIEERVIEEPIKELKEKKEYKVVIRDPENSSLHLFRQIWKLCVWIFKCLALLIAIPLTLAFIFFMVAFVFSLSYALYGIFFNGISIAIVGALVFIFLLLLFVYNLIFNRKNNYSKIFIIFIISIILIGLGLGVSFAALGTFDIYTDESKVEKVNNYNITMKDNLIISDIIYLDDDKVIIDNSLKDVKMDIKTYNESKMKFYTYHEYDDEVVYDVLGMYPNYDQTGEYKMIIEDLKNKKLNTFNLYNNYYEVDKIYVSQDNFTKLKNNYYKLYD